MPPLQKQLWMVFVGPWLGRTGHAWQKDLSVLRALKAFNLANQPLHGQALQVHGCTVTNMEAPTQTKGCREGAGAN